MSNVDASLRQVSAVTSSKILRILKKIGLAPEIPEDLYHLIKKAVSMRKHLEASRKDRDGKFRLILVESRIHRLARYYKVRQRRPGLLGFCVHVEVPQLAQFNAWLYCRADERGRGLCSAPRTVLVAFWAFASAWFVVRWCNLPCSKNCTSQQLCYLGACVRRSQRSCRPTGSTSLPPHLRWWHKRGGWALGGWGGAVFGLLTQCICS